MDDRWIECCWDSWLLSPRGVWVNTNWRLRKSPIDDGAQWRSDTSKNRRIPLFHLFSTLDRVCVTAACCHCEETVTLTMWPLCPGATVAEETWANNFLSHCPQNRVGNNKDGWMHTIVLFGNSLLGKVRIQRQACYPQQWLITVCTVCYIILFGSRNQYCNQLANLNLNLFIGPKYTCTNK